MRVCVCVCCCHGQYVRSHIPGYPHALSCWPRSGLSLRGRGVAGTAAAASCVCVMTHDCRSSSVSLASGPHAACDACPLRLRVCPRLSDPHTRTALACTCVNGNGRVPPPHTPCMDPNARWAGSLVQKMPRLLMMRPLYRHPMRSVRCVVGRAGAPPRTATAGRFPPARHLRLGNRQASAAHECSSRQASWRAYEWELTMQRNAPWPAPLLLGLAGRNPGITVVIVWDW